MDAAADGARLVEGLHGEGDFFALDGGDLGLGPDLHAHGCGGVMGHVQAGAHGALARLQAGLHGVDGGVLHQGDHIGGGEHGHQPAAHGGGGVGLDYLRLRPALHSNGNRHCDDNSFQESIVLFYTGKGERARYTDKK